MIFVNEPFFTEKTNKNRWKMNNKIVKKNVQNRLIMNDEPKK